MVTYMYFWISFAVFCFGFSYLYLYTWPVCGFPFAIFARLSRQHCVYKLKWATCLSTHVRHAGWRSLSQGRLSCTGKDLSGGSREGAGGERKGEGLLPSFRETVPPKVQFWNTPVPDHGLRALSVWLSLSTGGNWALRLWGPRSRASTDRSGGHSSGAPWPGDSLGTRCDGAK